MLKVKAQPISFNLNATGEYTVEQYRLGKNIAKLDVVAEEVPVAFVYNGVSHAVMLATPQDLEDFALGFSLTEGIIEQINDVYGVEVVLQSNGIALQLDIASDCFSKLKEKRRNMTGRTGCGLCGSESLSQALRLPSNTQFTRPQEQNLPQINAEILSRAFNNIRKQQTLQEVTGATHASAFVDAQGNILCLREDVGRHNALDKLIGALKRMAAYPLGFVLTTSRASYEMVQKTASAGINMLVAISAPTGLAIRVAEQYGITLVGFTREHSYVVYCDPNNLMK